MSPTSYLTAPPRGVERIIDRQILLKRMEDPSGLARLVVRFAAQAAKQHRNGESIVGYRN